MAWDHALKMQTSHNINLVMACFSVKYAIYIEELEAKNKKEERRTRTRSLQSMFSRHKICCALSV
jgi:hypothetical protein